MNQNPDPKKTLPCSECSIGLMHPRKVAYLTWAGEELITVPDFPAWVCDMCGKREYDAQALRQLNLILSTPVTKKAEQKPGGLAAKAQRKTRGAHPPLHD